MARPPRVPSSPESRMSLATNPGSHCSVRPRCVRVMVLPKKTTLSPARSSCPVCFTTKIFRSAHRKAPTAAGEPAMITSSTCNISTSSPSEPWQCITLQSDWQAFMPSSSSARWKRICQSLGEALRPYKARRHRNTNPCNPRSSATSGGISTNTSRSTPSSLIAAFRKAFSTSIVTTCVSDDAPRCIRTEVSASTAFSALLLGVADDSE